MSIAGDWPPSSAAASAATSSRLSSLTSGIRSIPSSSVFESATMYYPSYAPIGGGLPGSVDDGLKPLPGLERYEGMDSGPWIGPFLGEEMGKDKGFDRSSSWMDPSSGYWASAFYKGGAAEGLMICEDASLVQGNNSTSLASNLHFGPESSGWLGDKYPAVYKENPRAPFDQSGPSLLDPSALFDRLSYSQSHESTSRTKACDTFNLNSTNNYTAQLASCSTNPMFCNPAIACSASTSVYDLSTERTISSMDSVMSENGYSTIQHAYPYGINLDYFDYIEQKEPIPSKEPTVSQIAEEGNKEWSIAAGNMKRKFGASVTSSPMKNDFPAGHDPLIGNLMECYSEAKCGLRSTRLSLTNSSSYASATVGPDNSMQTSSDPLDQHNLAVDSPCWRGAPSSRQHPFGTGDKADGCPVVNELKGHNDLDQGQKHHLVSSAKYVQTPSSEHVVSSVCRENQKDSSLSYPREPSLVSLPWMHQKFEDAKGECSSCAEAGFEKSSQVGNILEEKNNEATKDLNADSGPKDHALKQLGQVEGVSSSYYNTMVGGMANPEMNVKAAGQDGSSDFSPCARDHIMKLSSSEVAIPGKNVELLGSSDPAGVCSPSGEDPEPIVKAMHGLSEVLFSHYHRYVNELKEHDHELLHQVIDNLKACLVKNGKDVTKETYNAFGIEAAPPQVDVPKIGDDPKTSKNKGAKGMKHRMPCSGLDVDNDKVYDFCSVGFDTDCRTHMAQALHKVSKRGFDQEEDPQTLLYKNLWIEAEVALCSMKYELARMKLEMENDESHQRANSHDSLDMERKLSQLTRLRSLNSVNYLNGNDGPRYKAEEKCNTSTQPPYGGKESTMKPHEVKTNWADEIDASVLPRFEVLKSRSYNVKFSSVDEHPKVLNSIKAGGCVGTKEAVCSPHLDSENAAGLNYLPAKLADLGFSQQNQQSCTPDEPSSYLKPHGVNTNKTDEIDSSVMARFRVLQGRGDIPNSLGAKEYPGKLDSVDPGGCSETKETACSINLDSENTAGVKNLPAKFADLAFFQQNQQSYTPDEPISCSKPREVKTNRTDEVDSSVMARLSILRGRFDNVNTNDLGEHPKLLDSVDFEFCLGRKDAMCNSSGENNAREESENFMPTKLADLNFMQKNEQLCAEDEPSKRSSLLNSSSNIQHLGANSNDENELYLNKNSESTARESPVCTASGLVMPDHRWKQDVTGGLGSPSEEWEHVLKDELAWCSSA